MKRIAKLALTATLLGSLTGCGTPPHTDYYLLDALAPAAADATLAGDTDRPVLGVGPVEVAAYLQSREITRRDGYVQRQRASQRWGEPLDAGITRVLARNLAALTGSDRVVIFPWQQRQRPEQTVSVQVLELSPVEGELSLVASWTINRAQDSRSRLGTWRTPLASEQPGALAQATSALLLELSKDIAAALEAH